MKAFAHPIQTVSRLTGLSPFLIRIWEKRYAAVVPSRTPTNRRLYSQEQIEKLGLLRNLTQVGHPIGMLANLPVENLRRMAADSDFGAPKRPATSAGGISGPGGSPDPAPGLIAGCLAAVEAFDSPALDKALRRAEVMLGSQGALQRVVAPLACALGEHWRSGRITAAHEHFCSAALKGWLAQATRSYSAPGNGPGVVVGTPAGQIHELGALLFAATAAQLGWRVTYLGPNLRAPEIAGAAARTGAKAVALSLVYPEDDEQVPGEIAGLRSLLAPSVSLLVGGRAAPAYAEACRAAGAITPASLADIGPALEGLRRGDGADTESAATLPQRLQ